MLSRIAESLFWIGRYIERSDGTARILDVHLQLLLEDPWIEEDLACRSLLSVMGTEVPDDQSLTRQDVLGILAVDRNEPASIAFSLNAARENARRAREIVSTELWECLNTTRARMPRRVASDKVHEFFALGARALGARRRHHRVGDEPGRGVAVLHARPLDRARRHDGAAAGDPLADRGKRTELDHDPPLVRRVRGLPAHLPRGAQRAQRRRVPAAGPAVPARASCSR